MSIAPAPTSQANPHLDASKTPAKPRGRLIELDILRGFLLVWMTLTHLPTKANLISNQTFGFVSGAEGFIFLAGFMIGQLEDHIERKSGQWATFRDITKRTVRVYLYHCGLLAIAFTLVAEIGVSLHRQALENLLSYYLQSPHNAVIAAILLQYRPALLDILPMYVVFLALTPIARAIARRWSWDPVIYISLAGLGGRPIRPARMGLPARQSVGFVRTRDFHGRVRPVGMAAALDGGTCAREYQCGACCSQFRYGLRACGVDTPGLASAVEHSRSGSIPGATL